MRKKFFVDFTKYSPQQIANKHALLSPSNYHWVNYDEEKMQRVFFASVAAQRGTELHALAHQLIRLGVKLPEAEKTLNLYVNDAIGYRMTSEQILYYSDNCFGTADTCGFKRNKLRIHDLKTGTSRPSMEQLKIYAAIFCLEYRFRPMDIEMELRIYQGDKVQVLVPEVDEIFHVMDKIITLDKRINALRMEAL
jgi:hypothetical protein